MTSNVSADTMYSNMPNYLGPLFIIGKSQTPFLSAVGGGLSDLGFPINAKRAKDWSFPLGQTYELEDPSQPAISESVSMADATGTTYVGAEAYNICQIFQKRVEVSYTKQSSTNILSGLALLDPDSKLKEDPLAIQQKMNLKQMAADMDYTFLNGSYQALAGGDGNAAKTRGMFEAVDTNDEAGGAASLTTAMVENIGQTMFDAGAPLENIVIWWFQSLF